MTWIEGRLVNEPELKFTNSGMAVCNFRIVAADRKKDENDKWVDDKTLFLSVSCFKTLAENVAESCEKGDLIIVGGKLSQREYETKEGDKRTSYEVTANSVSVSLQFRKIPHGAGKAERASASAPAVDPWAAPEEPPF